MSRYAIISDVHGNLHAMQAVLRRIGTLNVKGVICLGDIVGYGPFPGECLDLAVRSCMVIVQGNHDQGAVDPAVAGDFNYAAKAALDWTREKLGPLHLNALCRLPLSVFVDTTIQAIHDNPAPGPSDYVNGPAIAAVALAHQERPICLIGHTHVPMVYSAPDDAFEGDATICDVTAVVPGAGVPVALNPGTRYLCNPGSVGQPRDADPRASFAVLDLDERTFVVHREEYDIDAAQMATQRAGLPFILAERLAIGA
jgi:predicted phosphodiesterase